jgi:hypothetical protein
MRCWRSCRIYFRAKGLFRQRKSPSFRNRLPREPSIPATIALDLTRSPCNIAFENSASEHATHLLLFAGEEPRKTPIHPRRVSFGDAATSREATLGRRCFPPFVSLSSLLHSSPCHFRRIACHETSQAALRDPRASLYLPYFAKLPPDVLTRLRLPPVKSTDALNLS